MLTKEAFNALLKTLEEPPPHILFIFATTEIHKVPATIVSRCQRFDFRRITVNEIITNLKTIAVEEGIHIDDDALLLIAKKGDGSLRDSQSIFDQAVSLCGKQITHEQIVQALNIVDQDVYFRVTDLIKTGNTKGGLELIEEIVGRGYDIKEFLGGLTEHLRNILIAKTTESTTLIETSEVYKKRFAEESKSFTLADILRLQRLLNGTEAAIRWSAQPRFKLEADFIHMISMHRAPDVNELVQQIEGLKKKIDGIDATTNTSTKEVNGALQKTRIETTSDRREQMDQNSLPLNPSSGSLEQPTVVHLSSLKEDELTVRWQEFINEVRRRRISLGLILESATLLEAGERTIRIGCANEFQASSIKKQERFLTELLSKVFNASARLEVEIGDVYQKLAAPQRGVPEQKGGKAVEEHPVTKAIIREFGAEPL
jgi:DNA polymerase III gamma/tau subunit